MGLLDILERIGKLIPSAPRPPRRIPLPRRLLYTVLVVVAFIALSSTPLYGIPTGGGGGGFFFSPIISIVLAMTRGTLGQLGIGPIVTAGLILQILVGAKLIKLDLTNPEDRIKFTFASKGLAVVLSFVEAAGFAFSGYYWGTTRPSIWIQLLVMLQLVWGALLIIMLDEAMQKGWGLGSGISLFILVGVARRVFVDLFSPIVFRGIEPFGIIPATIHHIVNGRVDFLWLFIERARLYMPTYLGLITTFSLIAVLAYLQIVRINIPITSPRMRGIRARIPLQLLYVTNIPVLLTAILFSDIILFSQIAVAINPEARPTAEFIRSLLSPPSIYTFIVNPLHAVVYIVLFLILCILFGIAWIEIAGLNPEAQAENLIRAGMEIPGMRRNPKILASYLARYIYPLTLLSSIIVATIALIGDVFMSYGTGTGLLLAVGILYGYYQMLMYERALEIYPGLKRLLGER